MAPATNLGAATPIQIGGMPDVVGKSKDEKADKKKPDGKSDADGAKSDDNEPLDLSSTLARKQVHDAAAYIRSLAQMRGRNAEWAERAVLDAASLSAAEALKLNVINLIAADVPDLLKQLNGRKIVAAGREHKLDTGSATVETLAQDWRTRFLSIITEPSIAYILLLVGLYAIVFELTNPGLMLPGVAGTICILIALYAFHLLPVNYAGLALIVLGIGFMVAEVFFPVYGSLAIGGVIAFVIGSVILIDTDAVAHGIPWGLIGGFAAASLGLLATMVGMALKARRLPVVSGREELIGSIGEVVEDCAGNGWARIHGEVWRIRSHVPLKADQRVRVVRMLDLVLEVVPESD
ncbi:Putative membrane-bound ClpP-class protease associated with aq_911 [Georgfuchsia toluolica]|uniref:Membrane-bound ClpP-class protease associated with aq_911 n=1 Tax=Georgfuchsia toluolica TaxID=424218 RepID=A0A916MZ20_9PROT|nr:nodulation protein NfeD [Georgfuchsia toluolica]CAG4882469.1 Putative membrane-bound ClpP-class protease associated with aq_911 [Georgfuchsia toluolica]